MVVVLSVIIDVGWVLLWWCCRGYCCGGVVGDNECFEGPSVFLFYFF